jgi:hypothetical protein
MLHLLAGEPPSVCRHNGDVAYRQAREPREKNYLSPLCLLIGFTITQHGFADTYNCRQRVPLPTLNVSQKVLPTIYKQSR